ncbi:transmembrane emp24 domain-containing protein 1-like [Ostrinia nubilalis]|uniref:transmembrane emp24 domain-containing protein 1-like n=1 Tax=Ostrinia nubilalis TaxID=29057 RepID=UPI003082341D
MILLIFIATQLLFIQQSASQTIHESDINFRVEAGSRTCFFEKGKAGQMMEAYYQVLDGQHGDLDIIFEIMDPNGVQLLSDYKKSQNSIIMDLTADGDYVFCLDNTYSMMNSKLVFVYVVIEDKVTAEENAEGSGAPDGEEVLEWSGVDADGQPYYIEVDRISNSLTTTLRHVVKARQLLDMYGAMKSRDSYLAFEDTFIVDMWSGFQISFMLIVGTLQVYMIKKLFNKSAGAKDSYY